MPFYARAWFPVPTVYFRAYFGEQWLSLKHARVSAVLSTLKTTPLTPIQRRRLLPATLHCTLGTLFTLLKASPTLAILCPRRNTLTLLSFKARGNHYTFYLTQGSPLGTTLVLCRVAVCSKFASRCAQLSLHCLCMCTFAYVLECAYPRKYTCALFVSLSVCVFLYL
jgi:hypothetical protein